MVWHSALTKENAEDLERVQKCAVKLILGEKYENYDDALTRVHLDSLYDRREKLCKNFGLKCINSDNLRAKSMFPVKEVIHPMEVRKCEKFEVNYANTGRLTDSAIPYMQRILNNNNVNEKGKESKRKVLHQGENIFILI